MSMALHFLAGAAQGYAGSQNAKQAAQMRVFEKELDAQLKREEWGRKQDAMERTAAGMGPGKAMNWSSGAPFNTGGGPGGASKFPNQRFNALTKQRDHLYDALYGDSASVPEGAPRSAAMQRLQQFDAELSRMTGMHAAPTPAAVKPPPTPEEEPGLLEKGWNALFGDDDDDENAKVKAYIAAARAKGATDAQIKELLSDPAVRKQLGIK